MKYRLLTAGEASPKVCKIHDVESAILYLAPYTVAKGPTVCPWSTPGCRAGCLFRSGRGAFKGIQGARVRRTRLLRQDVARFAALLDLDLIRLQARAHKRGIPAVARLNGTADLDWTATYRKHPKVRFWEYTKSVDRVRDYLRGDWPRNASVCYSRNEVAGDGIALALQSIGAVVAVVFRTRKGEPMPATWHGLPVTDGDATDARWMDAPGTIVGLRAKGPAKRDRTGFVLEHVAT